MPARLSCSPNGRLRRGSGLPWLMALAVCLLGGCRTLGTHPISENVVAARQLSLRGMEALQQGQLAEAERLFEQAIATCPVDERARRHYADLLWRRGEHAQAVRHMEEALRLSGGDASLLVALGQMQLARGETERARSYALRAVAADRRLASAWAILGDTQRATHEIDEALASYHRALSLEEFYPQVQLAVAEIYRAQNRPQRALATLASLESRYGPGQAPSEVLFQQGLALKQLGRPDDAVQAFHTALAHGDESADRYFELADAQLLAGDPVNARLSLRAALEQTPEHARSRRLLAMLDAPSARSAGRPGPDEVRPGDVRPR